MAAIAITACAGCATTGGKVAAIAGAVAAAGAVVTFGAVSENCGRNSDVVLCTSQAGAGVVLAVVSGLSFLTSMVIEIYSAPDLPPTPPRAAGATPPPPLAPPGLTPVSGEPVPTRNH